MTRGGPRQHPGPQNEALNQKGALRGPQRGQVTKEKVKKMKYQVTKKVEHPEGVNTTRKSRGRWTGSPTPWGTKGRKMAGPKLAAKGKSWGSPRHTRGGVAKGRGRKGAGMFWCNFLFLFFLITGAIGGSSSQQSRLTNYQVCSFLVLLSANFLFL